MADNLNISPDMVQNLINMLKNSSNAQSSQNTQNEYHTSANQNNQQENNTNTSQSNQQENNTNTSQSNQSNINSNINQKNQYDSESQSGSSASNIDFETIMKMKSIMETLNNSNDQDSKLLYSLKPYLRKSRQAKLDQYINILKITQVSKLFNAKSENK